jgi:murein DD-endopeptidase MepM/ murein hydrolase activator NlpD
MVCSPLQGINLADLEGAIVNPFNPPPPGSDNFHQGVDFGDLDSAARIALSGRPVQTVIPGRIIGIFNDKFPYGNAVLIETPLRNLPQALADRFSSPTPIASPVASNLSCPSVALPPWDTSSLSLYVLYAHLEERPELMIEGRIDCGVTIGKLGGTGNALNPHLHLEVRVGPAGARFPGLAHYDTSARAEEMAGYCAWRVGGEFKILDPLLLFELN